MKKEINSRCITMLRILSPILIAAVMLMIYLFSAQDGAASLGTSDIIVNVMIGSAGKSAAEGAVSIPETGAGADAEDASADTKAFQHAEAPDADNAKRRKTITDLVRKAGHIGEFALLAFLIALHVSLYRKRPWLWAIASCAVYAAGDELHQLLPAGRSASITDVLIDICGAAAGAVLFLLLTRRRLPADH